MMRAALFLLLLLCVATCRSQTTISVSTSTSATAKPTTVTTKTPLHHPQVNFTLPTTAGKEPNHPEDNGALGNVLFNALNLAANSSNQQPFMGNNFEGLSNLMSQLPALLKGVAGIDLEGGNGAAYILASIFSDPRAAGIPAWIEALSQGSNMTQALQNAETLLQMLSSQNVTNTTQVLLDSIFSDVTKGLQSLHLNANSSLQDVISAVMKDPGLMSSLSTEAIGMLSQLTGGSNPQAMLQQAFPVDPHSQCAADLQTWATSLQSGQLWAISMLDATGKPGAGLLMGQIGPYGDYDECMDISYTTNTSHVIEGLFCGIAFTPPIFLAEIIPAKYMGLHLCVPKSCHEQHLKGLLEPTFNALGSHYLGTHCNRPRDPEGDNRFLGVMITIGILVLLCTAGTFYGVVLDHKKQKKEQKETEIPLVESSAYHGYTTNGEAADIRMHNGDHVNGKLTNEDADHVNGKPANEDADHVNGTPTNEDASLMHTGVHVSSELPPAYVKHYKGEGEKDDLKNIEPIMIKRQNVLGAGVVSINETASYTIPDSKPTTCQPSPEEGMASKLLLSFSVLRNGRKVLNCDQNQADISCLHGIRVLSITWVVLGHCFSMITLALANPVGLSKLIGYFTYMAILGGVYAVDTFFLMSGCLSAFLFLRTTQKCGLTVSGMVLYYIHRYWRLTPLYGLLIAFYVGIFPYLKEGPHQFLFGMDSEGTCREYWYYNILYVNNFFSQSKMCFGWSWYLANDMQFSYIAPLVLIPWTFKGSLTKLRSIGFVLCAGLIVTHCVATGVIRYENDAAMVMDEAVYKEKIYNVPWCRAGPYALGLLLGYMLFVTKRRYTMNKLYVFLGWTLATGVGMTVVYIQYDNVSYDLSTKKWKWDASEAAAFESLDKVLWAACVAWVIFACCTGYGGFVNTLLSWSAWMPLSRLTYGVYLIHLIVLWVLVGNFKRPFYADAWTVTMLYLAVTVLSFLVSFIFSMLIEAPTLGLEKVVLGKIFRQKK